MKDGDATLIPGPIDMNNKRINILFDAGDMPRRDSGNILRAVLRKNKVNQLDYEIISHFDADHIGGIVRGGVHGDSFVLGFNDQPSSEGDDDGDGQANWLAGEEFFTPDPEELRTDDDMPVLNWVDRGDVSFPKTQAIRKYMRMANSMGARTKLDTQSKINTYKIELGGGL